ncbi:SNF2 family N-terminal domain containing protein [Histoplasma ohiense]|nr:SNF2 family N-terminal domain containing protein [Histoplasma ohiense (nom. inval.)]
MCSFSVVVHILEHWLCNQGLNAKAVHSELKGQNCDDLVYSFNSDESFDEGDKAVESSDILISTIDLLSTGFTCVRAWYLILFGPEWLSSQEEQAITHIQHIEQKNEWTFTYCLVCQNLDIERAIIN